ncbi:MAG: Rab family GTPase [Hyphomicrobiaceae bacterium]
MPTRKVMLLGDIAVGKTSLVRRLVLDRFEADYKATIGVDIYTHDTTVDLDGNPRDSQLVVWDIDGDLGDSIFNHIYIRGASGALVIGDGTRPATMQTMVRLADGFRGSLPGRPLSYVVNKADIFRGDIAEGMPDALEDPAVPLHITSARSGANVREAFAGLALAIERSGL